MPRPPYVPRPASEIPKRTLVLAAGRSLFDTLLPFPGVTSIAAQHASFEYSRGAASATLAVLRDIYASQKINGAVEENDEDPSDFSINEIPSI
jgi:hypothetical protein